MPDADESTTVQTMPDTSIMAEQMRRSPVFSGSISPYPMDVTVMALQ